MIDRIITASFILNTYYLLFLKPWTSNYINYTKMVKMNSDISYFLYNHNQAKVIYTIK